MFEKICSGGCMCNSCYAVQQAEAAYIYSQMAKENTKKEKQFSEATKNQHHNQSIPWSMFVK